VEFGWIAAAELIFRLAGKYSANVWFGDRVCLRSATFVGQPATLKLRPETLLLGAGLNWRRREVGQPVAVITPILKVVLLVPCHTRA
jgi:hypothetical protein